MIECVPNFSEGRDAETVLAIAGAVRSVSGVALLDMTLDADHHRSVLTFAGAPMQVVEAAYRAIAEAVSRIDLRAHDGAHPRVGAADVVPVVPVQGVSLAECAKLARELGRRIWNELRLPVYFYGAAAEKGRISDLSLLRRAIRSDPHFAADLGGLDRHATAGVSVVGARGFLIAYNIDLDSTDVGAAQLIARAVRESSGGLRSVKALGLWLQDRGRAQVSMNLTDFSVTSIVDAYCAVERECARLGIGIAESELIGLAPAAALNEEIAKKVKLLKFSDAMILENRLKSLGF